MMHKESFAGYRTDHKQDSLPLEHARLRKEIVKSCGRSSEPQGKHCFSLVISARALDLETYRLEDRVVNMDSKICKV